MKTVRVLLATLVALPLTGCVTSRVDPRSKHPGALKVGVEVFDPAGRKESNFGPRPQDESPSSLPAFRPQTAPAPQDQESPYARFGENIVVHKDKRITKFYYITRETGVVLLSMLAKPGAEPLKLGDTYGPAYYTSIGGEGKRPEQVKGILQRLLEDYEIELELIGNWDRVASLDMAAAFTGKYPQPAPGAPPGAPPDTGGPVNDLLMVTATADGLEKFEQTLNLFYAQVPQVEIEAKILEFSYGEALDLGVTPINANTPVVGTTSPKAFFKGLSSFFPNTSPLTEGLLTIGGIQDDIAINAVLHLLQTKAKTDIVSKPRVAVRNSGMAQIETTSQIPFPEAKIIGTNVQTNIAFKTVGVRLHIRPVIAGTETVILNIFAEVSAVTGFEKAEGSDVPIPIISTRSANTSVHVPNKKTIIIGGLLTNSEFENESKVPILGDIPILGYLFRSTSKETSTNEVVFFISPRIIQGFRGERTDAPVGG